LKRRRWLFVLLALCLVFLPATGQGAATETRKHVLLIDGSGSMESTETGVFLYSTGKLYALVRNLLSVNSAFQPQDQLSVGIFSKTHKGLGIQSPAWVFRGTVDRFLAEVRSLKPLEGWTDLVGTLDAGVAEVQSYKGPQFVWLLTDNIEQEKDDADTTEQFYNNLATRSDLSRIYVFPIDLGTSRGLVLYGAVRDRSVSTRAGDGELLDQAVAAINKSALRSQLGDGGFLVRPLADQPLDLAVKGFEPAAGDKVTFAKDEQRGGFTLQGYAEGKPIRGKLHVQLTSRFKALKIVTATVEARLNNVSSGDFSIRPILSQEITPTKVSLGPGDTADYTVALSVEPPHLAWNVLQDPAPAFADEGTIRGQLSLVVKDVTYAAVQPDKFYKVQKIPEILGNRSHATMLDAEFMTIHVALPWWRTLVVLGVPLGIILLAVLVYMLTAGRSYRLRVTPVGQNAIERVVTRRHPLVVGALGKIQVDGWGRLVYHPAKDFSGEKSRILRAERGEVLLKTTSFRYELVKKPARTNTHKGGYRHDQRRYR
jgi:hypothetical protein